MKTYRYELVTKKPGAAATGQAHPLWWPRRLDTHGLVDASIDPWLTQLGAVEPAAVDLVRISNAMLLADRLSPRDAGWTRSMSLRVPVLDPKQWGEALPILGELIHFVSGDDWRLELTEEVSSAPRKASTVPGASAISLFSGGLDSFSSAAAHGSGEEGVVYLSHRDGNSLVIASQNRASEWLTSIRPDFGAMPITLGQREAVAERSMRSRALLFVALGVAAASARGADKVLIPENGFTSLNPPLTANRGGSLSTRSTHPRTLWLVNRVLDSVALPVRVENPHEWQTKGEIVGVSASDIPTIAEGVATTLSCSKLDARFCKANPTWNCGLCFACIVRRGAVLAAGLKDETEYVATHGSSFSRLEAARRRRDDIGAVRFALEADPSEDDLIGTGAFPPSFDFDRALAMWGKALEELRLVDLP